LTKAEIKYTERGKALGTIHEVLNGIEPGDRLTKSKPKPIIGNMYRDIREWLTKPQENRE